MEEAIVMYPSPAIGHLISMVELGKLILTLRPSLSINILITTLPYDAGSTSTYINQVSATTPSIAFHHLPPLSAAISTASPHHEALAFQFLNLNIPNVLQALVSLSKTFKIRALVMDFFCAQALSVSVAMEVPGYLFMTSGASTLAWLLYQSTLHKTIPQSFKDLKADIQIPGLPPMPAADMPKPVQDRDDEAYEAFLIVSNEVLKSAGIIINTFKCLEPRVIKAISHGLCSPDGQATPPLHCIGPLISGADRTGGRGECFAWLDSQPRQSVVFLCFGSLGLFSKEQLKEMAVGLERSGQRFLWVVRSPEPETDLEALLPAGFVSRTKDRGLVVGPWAPQVSVLNHDSVGGFVTHCGWNSVLEALCAGVPMAAWPLYAEQRLNRVVLVEEMKLALPVRESEGGFVAAGEVEKRVRELMESEEGKSVRKRVLMMKRAAEEAMEEGGSSITALSRLVDPWTRA
ncbi:UDP-glycosyltransferase 88A1-like [Diospyros lotus]|uniref:UDP-glycosyltransferase 88A1-like n=1 Tax=Diospyros lotus TaxID=55363 RepID=UPI002255164C|nr:UDP-glycosyltransferase 88A1-like [Diospyros lotus]